MDLIKLSDNSIELNNSNINNSIEPILYSNINNSIEPILLSQSNNSQSSEKSNSLQVIKTNRLSTFITKPKNLSELLNIDLSNMSDIDINELSTLRIQINDDIETTPKEALFSALTCRICSDIGHENNELLTDICNCKETHGSVHANCLRKWLFMRPTPRNRNNLESPFITCEICNVFYSDLSPTLSKTAFTRSEISDVLIGIGNRPDRKICKEYITNEFVSYLDESIILDKQDYLEFLPTLLDLSLELAISYRSDHSLPPLRRQREPPGIIVTAPYSNYKRVLYLLVIVICILWPLTSCVLMFSGIIPFKAIGPNISIIIISVLCITSMAAMFLGSFLKDRLARDAIITRLYVLQNAPAG